MNGIRPPPGEKGEDSFMIYVLGQIDTSHITPARYEELKRACTSGYGSEVSGQKKHCIEVIGSEDPGRRTAQR
jgi:hypothetical protein